MLQEKRKIEASLIDNAVQKLKGFGFIHVTRENIKKDEVYKYYFIRILIDYLGQNNKKDTIIHRMLDNMKQNNS